MKRYRGNITGEGDVAVCCCLVILLILVNLLVGGIATNYTLDFCIGKQLPLSYAIPVGVVLGEIAIPSAGICFLLDTAGVKHPLFPQEER